jgi:hypothetical protein
MTRGTRHKLYRSRNLVNRSILTGRRAAGLVSLVLVGASVTMMAAPSAAEPLAVVTCPGGGPTVQLANPGPGDVLSQGDYIVSGMAYDPASTQGDGISRIDLFLGQRDSGGLFLGAATPGEDSSNPRAFSVKVTLPDTVNGGRDFVAYAYSTVTGNTSSESVPVFVGAAPTATPITSNAPTPVPLTSSTQSTCLGGAPVPAVAPPAQAQSSVPAVSMAEHSAPVLQLGNPNPGDVLSNGDLIIQGVAYDPNGSQANGIDRVELFLDNRDEGGLPLGSGAPASDNTFKIKATLPSSANGGHNVVAYARSSVTGLESVESVPVFVGAAPTPTPRPK